jgi:hypothetical protein
MEILLGWMWSQDGVELKLQPRVVEVVGLSALKGLRLNGMQTKADYQLSDGVNVGR